LSTLNAALTGVILSRQLFKSTLIVSCMTLISRLLGFVRDMLIARLFGVDLATDAFFVAFKIPNFLRRLFTDGAFAHAFVPIVTEYKEKSDPATLKQFIGKSTGTLAVILLAITLIGAIIAPLLIIMLAPGFPWQGTQHDLAVQMLQITLPYLFFIGLTALVGSILNAHDKFALPALTPAFLNIFMIAAAIYLAPKMHEPVIALAWGVFIAGIVQVLFQLPALVQLGLLPRLQVDFKNPGVQRFLKQLLPSIFSVSVTQINLLLDTLVASFLTVGSVSWLYYSDRLVEFPVGILGLALGSVILPHLAKNTTFDNREVFSQTIDWGLRLAILVGMPATLGLILLAEPLLSTLFQYKEFGFEDVLLSAQSLRAYALGVLGYILIKILVGGFTARQDMKTPVRYGIYAMVASLALNVLAIPLHHAGLALATSLGAFFNVGLLLKTLLKQGVYRPTAGWLWFFLRIVLASAAMSWVLYTYVNPAWWQAWSSSERVLNLLMWVSIGILIYAATLLLSGLRLRHLTAPHDRM
jgi:putative peptidoglycan lipid II flippase